MPGGKAPTKQPTDPHHLNHGSCWLVNEDVESIFVSLIRSVAWKQEGEAKDDFACIDLMFGGAADLSSV